MTNEAEARTALDETIDDVAHAMTVVLAPDLRRGVAERLDGHGWAVRWWQPALVMTVLILGIVLTWSSRDVTERRSVQERPFPTSPAPEPAPLDERRSPGGTVSVVRAVRPSRSTSPVRSRRPDDTRSLPPIQVAPILVERLDVVPAASLDISEMPRLVLEPLDVEPLVRSNR